MSKKIAFVTGGGAGIGKATAIKLASQGISVVATDYKADRDGKIAQEIEAAAQDGAVVRFVQCDVRDEQSVKAAIEQTITDFGRLDMAVNNAGIAIDAATLDTSNTDDYRNMVDTNILGTYFCLKYEIQQMKKQGHGSIVNMASIVGLNGMAGNATYSSTKHAIVGLTKSAALDHATEGVRINAVAPGGIVTDMARQAAAKAGREFDEAAIGMIHPMQRMGRADEIADGVVWLLSNEANFVTGHILNIDGGFQAA